MVPDRQSRARRAGADSGSGGDGGRVGCGIYDDVLPRGKGGQGGNLARWIWF